MPKQTKKHLKRLNAPSNWMLDKMGGAWATRPRSGAHKLRESLPLILLLRNKLKYAFNAREVMTICMNKCVAIDGKIRTDHKYPIGFMDVISIKKTNENFRLLYDTKGRFFLNKIGPENAKYKLCKVASTFMGIKKVPMLTTHDSRTIRYPDPQIQPNDTIKVDLKTGKILGMLKYELGALVMITRGRNCGRVGVLTHRERHLGGFDIIHVKDKQGNVFATRSNAAFVIGKGEESEVILPKNEGVKLSILEEREQWQKKQKN